MVVVAEEVAETIEVAAATTPDLLLLLLRLPGVRRPGLFVKMVVQVHLGFASTLPSSGTTTTEPKNPHVAKPVSNNRKSQKK